MPKRMLFATVTTLSLLVAAGPAAAQFLSSPASEFIGLRPDLIAARDLDGDGEFELFLSGGWATGAFGSYQVFEIWEAPAPGQPRVLTQTLAWDGPTANVMGLRQFVGLGEVHGDGLPDVVIQPAVATFTTDHYVVVFPGLSGGLFGPPEIWLQFPWVSWMGNLQKGTLGDFDGDGLDDVATSFVDSTGRFVVARSTGTSFDLGSVTFGVRDSSLRTLRAADVNGDGPDDLIELRSEYDPSSLFGNTTRNVLSLYSASGGGALGAEQVLAATPFGQGSLVTGFATGDLDGDGMDDIVTLSRTATGANPYTTVVSFWGAAAGLPAPGAVAVIQGLAVGTSYLVDDVDGDGRDDVLFESAVAGSADRELLLARPSAARVATPTVSSGVRWSPSVSGNGAPTLLADQGGDGDLDLLMTHTVQLGAPWHHRFDLWRNEAVFIPSCPGAIQPELGFDGSWLGAGLITVEMQGGDPGQVAYLAVSFGLLPGPACGFVIDPTPGVALPGSPYLAITDGSGRATWPFAVAPIPALEGVPVFARAVTVPAGGFIGIGGPQGAALTEGRILILH